MKKSSLIVLFASILACVLCVTSVAQEKTNNYSRNDLAIEIGNGRYGPPMPVPVSEGSYRQSGLPERPPDWKPTRETATLTALRFHPVQEGDGVRVKIGVVRDDSQPVDAPGPKYGEREEIIASYLAHLGDIVTIKELERFGLKPLDFKVVTYQKPLVSEKAPPLTRLPKFASELKSVGLVDWRPDSRSERAGYLVIKNLTALNIVAITLEMSKSYTHTIEGTRAHPLAKPGATYETTFTFSDYDIDEDTTMLVKGVLFDDGSFEGDVEASAAVAARIKGREIQLSRFLELLRQTSLPAGERPVTVIQNLKSAVEKFRIDVDQENLEQLQSQFSFGVEKRTMIAEKIMEGLKAARFNALSMIRDLETKLAENPAAFDLPQSLAALQSRVAKLVEIPEK